MMFIKLLTIILLSFGYINLQAMQEDVEQDLINCVTIQEPFEAIRTIKHTIKNFKAYTYQDNQGNNVTLQDLCQKKYQFPDQLQPMTLLEQARLKYSDDHLLVIKLQEAGKSLYKRYSKTKSNNFC